MAKPEYKAIQGEAKGLAKALTALAGLNPTSGDFVRALRNALSRLPEPSEAQEIVARIRESGNVIADDEARVRSESFRALEAEFVRTLKDAGISVRELNESWRVGSLELAVRREASQAQCKYNRQPISDWQDVSTAEELLQLHERAVAQLEKSAIDETELVGLVERAFEDAYYSLHGVSQAPRRLPILDLLRSVRLERVRQALAKGDPGKPLRNVEMPMWALLYNIDRYREIHARSDSTARLQFETGSQNEQKQGKSVLLNGLSATRDYMAFTYVVQRAG